MGHPLMKRRACLRSQGWVIGPHRGLILSRSFKGRLPRKRATEGPDGLQRPAWFICSGPLRDPEPPMDPPIVAAPPSQPVHAIWRGCPADEPLIWS